MNFERTVATEISSDFILSKVGLGRGVRLPCTMFVTYRAPHGSPVNGHFTKLKKLSDSLVGGHATMACHLNAAAAPVDTCALH